VGEEFSASTKTIFEINPAWKNVTEIFRFNKEEEHSFNKWCGNVWRKKLAFKDLLPLAPKACTRVEGKYIQLEFVPIYKNDEKKIDIDRIICKAIDKTLEKEFEKKAQEQKDKSAMVLLVLERPLEFLDLMEELGGIIESSLGKAVERNFDEIFRVFHTLKARFLQMKMMVLAEQIQLIETVFSDLRDLKGEEEYLSSNEKEWFKSEIGILGDLFKDFVKDNHKFIEMVNKSIIKDANEEGLPASEILKFIANELGHHSHFYNQFRDQFILEKISDKFSCYENLVRDISSSLGKEVVLLIKESSFKVDSTKYSKFINSCIHLFRNAVDHGIEDSWIRVEKGKNMCGKIKVRFEEIENDHFKIIVEDDGQGIDLDAVKSEALNLGGDIIVESSPGRGTTFMIILPLLK
jgi:two-component system chemotaxis sensor kinase CheA